MDVSAACPVLAAWDLHDNLDSHGAMLFRRFASRALAAVGLERPPGIFDEEFTPGGDPVHTPRGLNTDNPRVQQASRGRRHRPAQLGHPARRAAPRLPVRAPRHGADPDPRRARLGRHLQRDQRRLGRRARATRTCRTARATSTRRSSPATGLPGGHPLDPHVLAVDQPELAVLRRPDAHVLEQAMGRRGATARTRSRPTRTCR